MKLFAFGTLGLFLATSGAAATLRVKLTNAAGAPQETVACAREIVGGVFRAAGLDILWFDACVTDSQRQGGCPVSAGTFTVVINQDATRGWSRTALGCALPLAGQGDHAGVFYSRIAKVAHDPTYSVGASEADVLAHAIAHELGHLLLHTNLHSPEGLMRSSWRWQDFDAMRRGKLLFSQYEAGVLRREARRRENLSMRARP